jgi:hypothetical protein
LFDFEKPKSRNKSDFTFNTLFFAEELVVSPSTASINERGAGLPLFIERPSHQLLITISFVKWISKTLTGGALHWTEHQTYNQQTGENVHNLENSHIIRTQS